MGGFWERWRRKRLYRRHLRRLAPRLRRRFGKSKWYTPAQINACLVPIGLSRPFDRDIAFALFGKKRDFSEAGSEEGRGSEWKEIREDASDLLFDGANINQWDFTAGPATGGSTWMGGGGDDGFGGVFDGGGDGGGGGGGDGGDGN